MSSPLVSIVTLLESYRGRDKIMRLGSFAACFGSGVAKNPELKQKLLKVMTEISSCRTILRLFDDLSMLTKTLKYGMGRNEKDVVQRLLGLMSNIVNQLFFPIEHIAWAAEKGLISTSAGPWWLASLLAWISSLCINILSGLWKLVKIHYNIAGETKSSESNSSDVKLLRRTQRNEYFSLVENLSNLGMAVHWLPAGRLWSGKLSQTTVGVLGLTSTFIGLLKMTALK